MFIFRWIGTLFVLFALVAVAYDGTQSLAANDLVITPLGKHWFDLHVESLNLAQAAIERHVAPFLWDPIILQILQWPTWAVLGAIGFVLVWVGRRRKRLEPFAN